jgi:hypothetical protein
VEGGAAFGDAEQAASIKSEAIIDVRIVGLERPFLFTGRPGLKGAPIPT